MSGAHRSRYHSSHGPRHDMWKDLTGSVAREQSPLESGQEPHKPVLNVGNPTFTI